MDFADPPQNDAEEARAHLISLAIHASVPLASLDPTCQWTTDKDRAAVTALSKIPKSARYELGGVLYQNQDGEYCYSIPVGNKQSAHFVFKTDTPQGMKLAGIFHSHPGAQWSSDFSPDDIQMARKLHLDSYISDVRTSGIVKKLGPDHEGNRPTQGETVYDPNKQGN